MLLFMNSEDALLDQQKKAVEDKIVVRKITKHNAEFYRTGGGFVGMRFTGEDNATKTYDRIVAHRCFPFSDPTHYISIREPDGDGREIGIIEDLAALSKETVKMLEEQLSLRYFAPKILKIKHIHDEYGYSYWDVITDKGSCRFTVRMGGSNVYAIGKNRYMVNDLDGNRFEIPDLYKLSAREIKQLDLFI